MDSRQPVVERLQVRDRVAVALGPDWRRATLAQRNECRRDVRDRDESSDASRLRRQDPAVPAADDRDRVALRVVVAAGRRELDVDDRPGDAVRDPDDDIGEDLAAGLPAEQGVFDLAAPERGDRPRAADRSARSRDVEAEGGRLHDEAWNRPRRHHVDDGTRRLGH